MKNNSLYIISIDILLSEMHILCHYFVFLGSPYTLEIVDSSQVTASGEGLSTVEVNKRAMFIVNTHGASGGDVRVTVQSKCLGLNV